MPPSGSFTMISTIPPNNSTLLSIIPFSWSNAMMMDESPFTMKSCGDVGIPSVRYLIDRSLSCNVISPIDPILTLIPILDMISTREFSKTGSALYPLNPDVHLIDTVLFSIPKYLNAAPPEKIPVPYPSTSTVQSSMYVPLPPCIP